MGSMKDKTAIVGMGCSKFGENWWESRDDMIINAVEEALEDAGIELENIEGAFVGTHLSGLTGACLAEPLQWDNMPITRVENNCASGSEAIRCACLSVAAGLYDVAMAVGFEKSKDTGVGGLSWPSGVGVHTGSLRTGLATGPGGFAMSAVRYFHKYGLTVDEGKLILAKIEVKNHYNGSLAPKAHFQREISVEQVLKAPMVCWPLGLFDCCPTTDGAAAAIITRSDMAKNFREDYILIKGMGLSVGKIDDYSGRVRDKESDYTYWIETADAAAQAYQQAGVTDPQKEISHAEVHDCFSITELINYESLGFSARGEGKQGVENDTFALSGELPVNTDGGLKAFGHPLGASGIRMAYEVYKQLQGKADKRQIKNPRLGLTHTQGGNPSAGFQTTVQIFGPRE